MSGKYPLLKLGSCALNFIFSVAETVTMPSPGSIARMTDSTLKFLDAVSTLKRDDSSKSAFTEDLNASLSSEILKIRKHYEHQGISKHLLDGAETELEVFFNEISSDHRLIVCAIQSPDEVSEQIFAHSRKYCKNLEEEVESFFNEAVRSSTEIFTSLLPNSPSFELAVYSKILRTGTQNAEGIERIERKLDSVTEMLYDSKESKKTNTIRCPIRFGSRPITAAQFVTRNEQPELNEAIFIEAFPRTILVGMHGCGKTQLATAVATQAENNNWPLIAWINAQSRASICQDLRELGRLIGVDIKETGCDSDILTQRCIYALQSLGEANCLLIFDNVEDPDHLREIVPSARGIRILATTTRAADWSRLGWHLIPINSLERKQSVEMLLAGTGKSDGDKAEIIANKLGDLPLAISQAIGTIKRGHYNFDAYLEILEQRRLDNVLRPQSGDDYTDSVGTALWFALEEALEEIDRINPKLATIARRRLSSLALLAESGFPRDWLARAYYSNEEDEEGCETLNLLEDFSIYQFTKDTNKVFLHRLQGRIIRETWLADESAAKRLSSDTANLLYECFKYCRLDANYNPEHDTATLAIAEQIQALSSQPHSHTLFENEVMGEIILRTLHNLLDLSLPQRAYDLIPAALLYTSHQERTNRYIVPMRITVGSAFREAGHYDTAISILNLILKNLNENEAEEADQALSAREELARTYQAKGDYSRAIPEFERLITDYRLIRGLYHIDTLATRINLGGCYLAAGHFNKAIEIFQDVIQDAKYECSPDDETIFGARLNLVEGHLNAKHYDTASQLLEGIIRDAKEVLGEEHEIRFLTEFYRGYTHFLKCEYTDAISLLEPLHAQLEQIFGQGFELTLSTSKILTYSYLMIGNLAKAEKLCRYQVELTNENFGTDHYKTCGALDILSEFYRLIGDYKRATEILNYVAETRSKIYGSDHTITRDTYERIAKLREEQITTTEHTQTRED